LIPIGSGQRLKY